MPLTRTLGVGSQAAASAVATYRRTITPPDDLVIPTSPLLVYAMPRLTFWFRQLAGVLGCTVLPEFAVRSVDGLVQPAIEWLPLGPPVVINPAPTNPTILSFFMPARLVRVSLTRPAGQPTTVDLVMAGSL